MREKGAWTEEGSVMGSSRDTWKCGVGVGGGLTTTFREGKLDGVRLFKRSEGWSGWEENIVIAQEKVGVDATLDMTVTT